MSKLHLKTGDEVIVIAGKDKGKRGKIIQTFPCENRIVVEGVNMAKRHLKSRRQGTPGQVIAFAAPLHASNVQRIDVQGKPQRHTVRSAS